MRFSELADDDFAELGRMTRAMQLAFIRTHEAKVEQRRLEKHLVSDAEVEAAHSFWDVTYGVAASGGPTRGVNLSREAIRELLTSAAKVRVAS